MADILSVIKSKIETDLTEYQTVQTGYNLDYEDFLDKYPSFDTAAFISWQGFNVSNYDSSEYSLKDTNIIVFLKNTIILNKIDSFITVFDGLDLVVNGDSVKVSIDGGVPVKDDLKDVVQINLTVYG